MTGRQILGASLSAGVIGALAWGFFALELTRDQQIGFLGAAFGSFIAAATALGVVEFQARRQSARARNVVDNLLFDAHSAAQQYLESAHSDSMNQYSLLEAFVGGQRGHVLLDRGDTYFSTEKYVSPLLRCVFCSYGDVKCPPI